MAASAPAAASERHVEALEHAAASDHAAASAPPRWRQLDVCVCVCQEAGVRVRSTSETT